MAVCPVDCFYHTAEGVVLGRFNVMEKFWFWAGVILLGIGVSVTGRVMDFPNFGQSREAMQIANVIHAVAAVLFIALSLAHIYIGTIGMEGAYDAMRHGYVDETWAKEHHLYWYQEISEERGRTGRRPAAPPPGSPRHQTFLTASIDFLE
jgi:formate dehydrogenase subunit gamma